MGLSAYAALWFLPFALPICVWVAWSDMARMKIPNIAVLALLAGFLITGLVALEFADYLQALINIVAVLAIGFVMSSLGFLGAGDAKFATAMAPFVALSDAATMIMILVVCIILGFVTHRLARLSPLRKLTSSWESWERTREFPLGYPLAAALVSYLVLAAIG